jgi:hypothetical protein
MWVVWAFIITLLFPTETSFFIGSLRLSPYRVWLILSLIPCCLAMVRGRAGPFIGADALMLAFVAWATLAHVYNDGVGEALEPSGMLFIETMLPYAIARCFIRSRDDFTRMVNVTFAVVALLLPIAAIEAVKGFYLKTAIFGTVAYHMTEEQMRMGMHRAFTVFDHPILFGVFAASIFGAVIYCGAWCRYFIAGLAKFAVTMGCVFFSLSSGPMLAMMSQIILALWERLTRAVERRWLILGGLFAGAYVFIDIFSNRTPFVVIASYLSLNARTATGRAEIWHWAMFNIGKRPLLGLGSGQWEHQLDTDSLDAFWAFLGVFYGLPGMLFMIAAVVVLAVQIGRTRLIGEVAACRTGWMISLIGVAVAGIGVHYWGAIYAWFTFMLGSGAWMLSAAETAPAADAVEVVPAAVPSASAPVLSPAFITPPPPRFLGGDAASYASDEGGGGRAG